MPQGATLTDVMAMKGLPKSTAHRTINALVDIGFLEPGLDARHYHLGARLLRLLHLGCENDVIGQLIDAPLQRLADEMGEATILSRFRGSESIEIAVLRAPKESRTSFVQVQLGPTPNHACSTAKSILAFQAVDVVERCLAGDLYRYTDSTTTSREALLSELAEVRTNGYSVCDQEIDLGVYSIAVPVETRPLGVIYSLAVVGPAERMKNRDTKTIVDGLMVAARNVRSVLGRAGLELGSESGTVR